MRWQSVRRVFSFGSNRRSAAPAQRYPVRRGWSCRAARRFRVGPERVARGSLLIRAAVCEDRPCLGAAPRTSFGLEVASVENSQLNPEVLAASKLISNTKNHCQHWLPPSIDGWHLPLMAGIFPGSVSRWAWPPARTTRRPFASRPLETEIESRELALGVSIPPRPARLAFGFQTAWSRLRASRPFSRKRRHLPRAHSSVG